MPKDIVFVKQDGGVATVISRFLANTDLPVLMDIVYVKGDGPEASATSAQKAIPARTAI